MKKSILILLLFIFLSSCKVTSGGNCESWSEWKYDRTECKNNFWCFGKNQKATYKYYKKERQCSKGKQGKEKKEKVKCGC